MGVQKDNYTYSGGSSVADSFGTGAYFGQTFTAASSYTLDSISLKIKRTGSTGNLTVYLSAVDGDGLPTGDPLATGVLLEANIPTDALTVCNVTMSSYSIVEGTKYAIYSNFPSHGAPSPIITYSYKSPSGYSTGSYIVHTDSWAEYTTFDMYFIVYATGGVSKPTTPSPANGSGPGIDFSNWTFGWVDGGGATSFNLYAGVSPASLNFVTNTASTSYQIPVGSAFRTSLLGGLIYWRVDAIAEGESATGDVWSFDPRPGKASNPSPANSATGQRLNIPTLSWDAGAEADTYTISFTGYLAPISVEQAGLTCSVPGLPLDYETVYTWRVDPTNQFGTTTGDNWTFTTLVHDIPRASARYIADGSPVPIGTVFNPTTMYYTGENLVAGGIGRLVAAANNAIWVEAINT